MSDIVSNFATIRAQIAEACDRAGRSVASARLVAVSKTKPAEAVTAALTTGQTLFGESRVQEARDKIPLVNDARAHWHLIGPLQKNKVKYAVNLFEMIHSVDSVELAQAIGARMPEAAPMSILIQVNVGREPQKSGFLPEDLPEALRRMADAPGVRSKD
ncbi:putative alanine racemase domain-containing protein [Magnetofaba australis IT-1]|uniref:Putative alanine racemase domain-containing protein n=1 Tax=Magnetofaba australis IT-1 TaxID=1434232 RepID=A0A1Y2JZX5_9PROT|nr:YggS family pyridoxal phosphate-dependent enzyme [Magnetofaba australis]OSM00480.1 putative alanine racemase domain-containing protein [Magnetofaba australis IT-1]